MATTEALTDHDGAVLGLEVMEQDSACGGHLFPTADVVDLALNLQKTPTEQQQLRGEGGAHSQQVVERCADFKRANPLAGTDEVGGLVSCGNQSLLDLSVRGNGLRGVSLELEP